MTLFDELKNPAIYIYIYIYIGVIGVIVIVAGNRYDDTSLKPGRSCLHFA